MNKFEFKKEILQQAKNKHQLVINDLQDEIAHIKESESENAGQTDLEELSQDVAANTRRETIARELDFAQDELQLLNRLVIQEPLHDEVTLGSVIVTDKRTFYVSASIEEFKADGKDIFGISTKAPIYEVMKGLKKGDSFSMRNQDYHIKDLF
jgi:hypothetical protein